MCWSPLYDTRDEKEWFAALIKKNQKGHDKDREFKDEGVYPEFHGSYHMYHILDVSSFIINYIHFYLIHIGWNIRNWCNWYNSKCS